MSPFFSFVKKEFYHILRDKRTMLILLGMPIVEIILFGFALTNEVKNVRVAVYAPFEDETVRRLNNR
ncbi:MAG: ABC transporter permease, partial [Bacteroidales bacterium]